MYRYTGVFMSKPRKKLANPVAAQAAREYNNGATIEEIAVKHRTSAVEVYNWLRNQGCTPKGKYAFLGKEFPELTREQEQAMLKEQLALVEAENAYLRDAIRKIKEEEKAPEK